MSARPLLVLFMPDQLRADTVVLSAMQWLREATDDGRPWALWVPLLHPHPPFVAPEPFVSMHDRADVPAPIPAGSAVGKPGYVDGLRTAHDWSALQSGDYAEIIATYYGMVARVDDQLGRIVKTVDEIGAADDTGYVVFSDHGEYLGDYGLVEKRPSGLDPQLVANPLIVTMPGQAEGAVCDALVEMIDLLPTLLELAPCAVPADRRMELHPSSMRARRALRSQSRSI